MARLLAVSDEVEEQLLDPRTAAGIGHIDLVLGCGDLPGEYLDNICCVYQAPLLFVRGNHDPPAGLGDYPGGAEIDGQVRREAGLLIAGLEGSRRYSHGPHQYGEWQMMAKLIGVLLRLRRRQLDILITHGPPAGVNEGEDFAHKGLRALRRAADWMHPRLLLHGHVHPYGSPVPREVNLNETRVINVVGHRVIELAPK
jgi:Icc-related predicted phosphoesterase